MHRALYWLVLTACGRVGFDAHTDAQAALTVADTTMLPGTAVQLVASEPATWSALDGGSIDAAGVFVAPYAQGDVHVQATAGARTATGTVHVTSQLTPSAIGNPGALAMPSGMANQRHVAYVDGEWWVWSVDGSANLTAHHSADLVAWTDGATLVLPGAVGNDGRNLDVAVADLGGHHVVHAAVSFEAGRGRYHVRGEIAGDALAWGAPQLVNMGGNVSPDGPSTVITPGGRVIDGTGYLGTPQTPPLSPCGDGDVVNYTAAQLDDGTTSFDAMTWQEQVIWCVPTRVNARRLLADGETIYELTDDGGSDPDPVNIHMNIRRPDGTWLPDETTFTVPPSVFGDSQFTLNDWDATIAGRTLHAVRFTGTPEHMVYDLDTQTGWTSGGAVAPITLNGGDGIVIVPYGAGVLMAVLVPGGGIDYAFWRAGTWTAWHPLVVPAGTRTAIAAGEGPRPALIWTEQTGPSTYQLTGALLP